MIMVFGKPWDDSTSHDWLTRLQTDAHLQKLLIEYGACKSLPLLISAAGFGLGGIVGGTCSLPLYFNSYFFYSQHNPPSI
jgi:hypothetical protein